MIWFNGEMRDAACVDASGAGVLLGWGVFTTIGVRAGKPLWLPHHLRRLRRDAAACDIEIGFVDEEIGAALNALLRCNRIANGLARLTISRRDDGNWNNEIGSDFSILAHETAPSTNAPLRVSVRDFEPPTTLRGVKTTSYLPYLWHWRGAQSAGFDEALLVSTKGYVCDAARATPFWVRDEILCTPAPDCGPLLGVGREITLEWARECGISVREDVFSIDEMLGAGEVFLVSGARGPRWVERVGETGRVWNEGAMGARFGAWWAQFSV